MAALLRDLCMFRNMIEFRPTLIGCTKIDLSRRARGLRMPQVPCNTKMMTKKERIISKLTAKISSIARVMGGPATTAQAWSTSILIIVPSILRRPKAPLDSPTWTRPNSQKGRNHLSTLGVRMTKRHNQRIRKSQWSASIWERPATNLRQAKIFRKEGLILPSYKGGSTLNRSKASTYLKLLRMWSSLRHKKQ